MHIWTRPYSAACSITSSQGRAAPYSSVWTAGRVVVLVSDVTEREIAGAPPQVRGLLPMIPATAMHKCALTDEIFGLAQAYLDAHVVAPEWEDDCLHEACATLHRADVLVSWNFKHLVRLDRARAFNSVNLRLGYPQITISSPLEVQYADRNDIA